MAILLKQSTAHTFQLGPFVDATDGVTPEAALTIAATAVYVSKAGAAMAAKNDATALTGTGDALGFYDCVLNATDTGTLGALRVYANISGALPVWQDFQVVPANVWNSLVDGSDKLFVDAVELNSSATGAAQQAKVANICPSGTVFDDAGTYAAVLTPATSLVFYSDDITTATADFWNGRVVIFTSGSLQYQALQITDYQKVASYGEFTTTASTAVPGNDATFIIV